MSVLKNQKREERINSIVFIEQRGRKKHVGFFLKTEITVDDINSTFNWILSLGLNDVQFTVHI